MRKRKQELQDLTEKDRPHNDGTTVAVKERSDSFCSKQYLGDVVIPAFREIERQFEAEGSRVWIHVEANRAWLTIGRRAETGGEKEYARRLKYQVEVSRQTMKSRLYQIMRVGPQKEYPVGEEHEIAGKAKGKNVADVTSQDIIDGFMAEFEGSSDKETES